MIKLHYLTFIIVFFFQKGRLLSKFKRTAMMINFSFHSVKLNQNNACCSYRPLKKLLALFCCEDNHIAGSRIPRLHDYHKKQGSNILFYYVFGDSSILNPLEMD